MKVSIYCILLLPILMLSGCSIEPEAAYPENIRSKENPVRKSIPQGAISFEYEGHIIFHGLFNDSISARWAYDTGSPMTVIDSSFYIENGFSISEFIPTFLTGGGNSRAQAYIVEKKCRIGVKNEKSYKLNAFLIDLREAVGDKTADGILDLCFFGKRIYEINYEQRYLLIHDINYVPDSSWTSIPFEFKDQNRILLDAWIEIEPGKRISGPFLLDLGATGSFGISKYSAESAKLSQSEKTIRIMDLKNSGIGGGSTIALLEADKCGIGPYTFENIPIFYSTNTNGAFGTMYHNGIIGNRILSRFDLIIDFVNSMLFFRPNQSYEKEFSHKEGIGFSLMDRTISKGGFEINGIVRDSKADSLGLKLGDLILSFNGKKIEKTDKVHDFYYQLDSALNSMKVVLEIKRDTLVYNYEF